MDNLKTPGVIALLTFLLGLLGTGVTYMFSQHRKRSSIRITIISWLKANKESLSAYAVSLQKLCQDIENSDEITPQPYESNRISVQRINEFTINELNDALVQNLSGKDDKEEKSKMLFKLLRTIEFLEETQTFVSNFYTEYVTTSEREIEKWEKELSNLTNFMGASRPPNLPDLERILLHEIDKIGHEFYIEQSTGPGNPKFSSMEKFIRNLQHLLVETKIRGVLYDRVLFHVNSMSSPYLAIKRNKDSYKIFRNCYDKIAGNEFQEGNAAKYNNAIQNLEDCIDFYKNRKIRFFGL